ncbi:NUMOD3 domain-containing DNA-binding protein [Serratia marcescens]|uniref:NUMOD3 domain-containing DNA-binding protein n=1 Tax=Serratia marcescens TaxID=615 RepID=UPI001F15011A|nr:NUMOD3 domain-containing DNA-binding protein [Serratia marcescens]MDP8728349.1 NUMOD3 domain-containing DNA-binding protein [Serratia marcescens]
MNKNQVKTRSILNDTPKHFCVYKTVLNQNGNHFSYYGKQSYIEQPDPFYVGSGKTLIEKISMMSLNDVIEKTVLETFDDEQEALDYEQTCIINARKNNEQILNKHSGGAGGNRLCRMTDVELKARAEKISQSSIGRTFSEESRKKMSLAKLGKKRSPEACKAISEGRKGLKTGKRSAETIARMKAAQQARRAKENLSTNK